ncbi:DUF1566 domain-containing protein, partial [bacterium]|nr:DUF1566 domain-containing protein [bacterium]
GKDFGYIIPYDGYDSATYISMEELRTQSEKMGAAKHQLFIMDCCYGGLLGMRNVRVESNIPNYLEDVTGRVARQILTAGGKDQEVLDSGPDGHSVFTAQLLKALQQGMADLNKDSYITFNELCSFIVPSASNAYQTPATGTLPGHELGEFVFRALKAPVKIIPNASQFFFRRQASNNLSAEAVQIMLKRNNFFCQENEWNKEWNNPQGRGILNDFTLLNDGKIVLDHATALRWQQSGSEKKMSHEEAQAYVEQLNKTKWEGYNDWRLPTLEEAMSLIEPTKDKNDLYINPIFASEQRWIWTADKKSAEAAWVVHFGRGSCQDLHIDVYVRAVRSE